MRSRLFKICIVVTLCISLLLGISVPSQAIVLEGAALYGLGCLVLGLFGITCYAISNTSSNWNGLLRTIFGPDYSRISHEVKYVPSSDTLVIPSPTYNEIVSDVNSFVVSVDRNPCAIYDGHIAFYALSGEALNVGYRWQGSWRYNYAPSDGYYFTLYSPSNVRTDSFTVGQETFEYSVADHAKTYLLNSSGASLVYTTGTVTLDVPEAFPATVTLHAPAYESESGAISDIDPPVFLDIPTSFVPSQLVDTAVYPAVTVNMSAVADAVGAPPDTNIEDLLGDLSSVPPDTVAPSLDAIDFVPVDNDAYQDIAVSGTYDIVSSWDNPTEEPDTGSGSIFARILAWLIALYNALRDWFSTLLSNLWARFESVLQVLRNLYTRVGSILTVLSESAVNFLGDIPLYISALGDAVEDIWSYVLAWVYSLGEWLSALLTIWGFLPSEMVIPVYATLVIVIVVGLWKRWFE